MMKKICLLVAFFVLGKISYAQYPITQTLGSDSTIVISKGALQSRLINVTYTDTAAANLQRIRQYPGAQIATTTGGLNLWVRNANATAWIPVATGSGNNIYTIDGTLLGNRTLTGAGYSLTFNQLSKLLFNADSTTVNTDQATILNNGVSTLSVKGAIGRMFLVDTTAPADERIYELKSSNGEFYISILNDAQTSNDSAFLITSASRVGINTLNPDSTLKVGGGVNIVGGLRVGNLPTSPGTKQLRINAQGQFSATDTLIDAGGTVTSIATNNGSGITGGTITTTGTLAIDTTIISTKANVSGGLAGKLNISDTAAMLNPYLRKVDTASLSNRINTKLNISDTATMLSPYFRTAGVGLLSTGQTVYADTLLLSTRAWRQKGIDSVAALPRVTSVGLTMPVAFNVAGSPVTSSGTLAVTGAGLVSQYIRGDGTLANFPGGGGGGSSVSYYLNGGTNQGTFVGNTYYEMSKTAVVGSAANFSIAADGYIAQFITDAGDPALLNIPGGNWNFEMYFNASSGGGTPSFYVELYKYDGTSFTLIASSSAAPEGITGGTAIDLYTTALAVPSTSLTLTDRLAVRVYVTHSGRTITLHTQDNTLCQIITTFTTGITALNGLTTQVQYFTTGTSGTDFNISSLTDTHTFNLPVASGTNTGKLSNTDWTTFNNKVGGSLVNGYITKATGTNTIDTSQLFQSNGLIGIGTTSPTQKLQVSGNAYVNGQLFAGDTALSVYQVEGILNTPYVLGRKAVDNTISTEARPTGVMGHVVGRGSIANRLQAANFYTTTDSASTANSTGSLRSVNAWTAHNGSGSLTTAWGSYNIVQNKTTGTITNAYGSVSGVENRGATSTINKLHGTTTEIWNNYGGTIDTAFGQVISIYNNNAASNIGAVYGLSIGKGLVSASGGTHYWRNSGTIGTSYGLYLDTSIDVGTTKYALFSNSNSNSYFKAKLGVGTTSPDSAFQVATGALFQRGVRMSGLPQTPGTKALRIDASGTISYADTLIDAGGTVTSVATNTGTGITGGTITTSGTIAADTLLLSTRAWRQKGIDSVAALANSKVSSVSGTSPIASSGGTSPTISISQSSGSTNGFLSSTDWTTFNNKQNALTLTTTGTSGAATLVGATLNIPQYQSVLTNPVTGTGTTNYIPKFTSSSAIGNSIMSEGSGAITVGGNIISSNFYIPAGSAGTYGLANLSAAIQTYSGSVSPTNSILFYTNGSERMRLDASGNLGLGTSSPSAKLDVLGNVRVGGSGNPSLTISGTDGAYTGLFYINAAGGGSSKIYANGGSNTLILGTNSTDRVTLDASGNLGLGVSPSAWDATLSKAIQLNGGSLWGYSTSQINLLQNAFYNSSGDIAYVNSASASGYRQISGVHSWHIAPSGTAGNAISFTQAMTLDASGRLGIGTTSPTYTLDVNGIIHTQNQISGYLLGQTSLRSYTKSAQFVISSYQSIVGGGFTKTTDIVANADAGADSEIRFLTATTSSNPTERMRITNGGNVGIGTISPGNRLHVTNTGGSLSTLTDIIGRFNATTNTAGQGSAIALTAISTKETGVILGAEHTSGNNGDFVVRIYNGGADYPERMRITSGGNVGIGTTSPTQTLSIVSSGGPNFQLSRTGFSGYTYIEDDGTNSVYRSGGATIYQTGGTTERMRITSGGALLLNTTSTTNTAAGKIVNRLAGTSDPDLVFNNGAWSIASIGGEPGLYLSSNIVAATGLPSATQTAKGGIGFEYYSSTSPTELSIGIFGTPTVASNIRFWNNGSERMRITSGGELLINTTSDAGDYKLQVNGNGWFTGGLKVGNASGASGNLTVRGTGTTSATYSFEAADANGTTIFVVRDDKLTQVYDGNFEVRTGSIKTAAPSGGTAQPWRLGSAGVTLGGSNLSGVEVEINGTTYYLVTGYLPEPEPDPAALPASGPSGSYKTYNKLTPVKSAQDAKIQALERELAELKEMVKKLANK